MKHFFVIGLTRQIGILFVFYVLYLLFGSLCFVMLETSEEERSRNRSIETMLLGKRIIQTLRKSNFTDKQIHNSFLTKQKEMDKDVTLRNLGWQYIYGDKLFFAFILITTVGYGNVAPKSMLGQVVCIIYTLLGIPLHVILMRLLSFKFRGGLRNVFTFIQRIKLSTGWLLVGGSVFVLGWISVLILVPAYLFTISEDKWTYNRGIYFSFVSLTTIGLGDYVAVVNRDHFEDAWYSAEVIAMLIWMICGLGFVAMSMNMLSYLMGVAVIDVLDSKCLSRATAKRKMKRLVDLIRELNWQLVKSKPEDFHQWDEIEEFKNILEEHPEDVDEKLLRKMFNIVISLKEKAYDQLSNLHQFEIPMTPIIQQARDALPDVISKESTKVTFSRSTVNTSADKGSFQGKISKESLRNSEGLDVKRASINVSEEKVGSSKSNSTFESTPDIKKSSSKYSPTVSDLQTSNPSVNKKAGGTSSSGSINKVSGSQITSKPNSDRQEKDDNKEPRDTESSNDANTEDVETGQKIQGTDDESKTDGIKKNIDNLTDEERKT